MERKELIINEELKELLAELKAVDKNIVTMVEESEKAKNEFDKEVMIRQKFVDKMKPIVTDLFKEKLGEFEILADLSLTDEGNVEVKIIDELEAWKENKRKVKETTQSEPQKVDEVEKVDEILAENAE
jgi:hypothetical protein